MRAKIIPGIEGKNSRTNRRAGTRTLVCREVRDSVCVDAQASDFLSGTRAAISLNGEHKADGARLQKALKNPRRFDRRRRGNSIAFPLIANLNLSDPRIKVELDYARVS